jgi:aminoglycoside phosphotransferase (APT) family kinase protein
VTVVLDPANVTAGLRRVWPGVEVTAVERFTSGEWATMARLALNGPPEGVPEEVVLRIAPDPEMGAKETAVQSAVAAAGVDTPVVRATGGPDGSFGGVWSVMDFVDGRSLLAGLDAGAAVRRLPSLLRRLPAQLAETMTVIHRVDAAPVAEQVRAAAPSVAFSVEGVLENLTVGAELAEADSLTVALSRLRDLRPPSGNAVLCHGDLHPFNLLAVDDRTVVLDWTAALEAPAVYDVGLTWLLLRYPPLVAPRALRPIIDAAAATMARRFVHAYERLNPAADLSNLSWYTALHAARALVDLAGWEAKDDPRRHRHPWRLVAPGATRVLQRVTDTRL